MADYAAGRAAARDLALCLAFELPAADLSGLRLRLLADKWNPVLEMAGMLRLLPALAKTAEAKGLTAGIPTVRAPGQRPSAAAVLKDAWSAHVERSVILRTRLHEVLDALENKQIHPVLLKGARALWSGSPAWRSLRDFDLLVPAPATAEAVRTIMDMGYRPNADFAAPAGWHHGAELYRDDLPGWIEIHARGGVRRMEMLLPTARLVADAVDIAAPDGGRSAKVLPVPQQILHGLAHHHIGHRGDYYDEIDFKGLYEFAADIAALSEGERHDLLTVAARHPRLMASLELWLVAAAGVFGLPVLLPLRLAPDALRHWKAMALRADERARLQRAPRRFEGFAHEAGMSLDGERLRRVHHGRTAIGRLRLRFEAIRALVARAAVPD